MIKRLSRILTYASLTVVYLAMSSGAALAATTPTTANNGQALEIAPPLLYLNVDPGQTVNTQIEIRDVSSGELIVTGQVNDFVAAGEDGTPKVILNNTTPDPYTMKTWVQSLPSLDLIPRQIKTLPVTIDVPANASPGGHYGVIRFTAAAPSVQGGNGVSLSASIGVLVLLTVSGKITDQLSVTQFSATHGSKSGSVFQSGPVGFTELLKNSGNVHEQPTGQVTVTDMFGKKIGAVNVNVPPGNILPSSTRKFTETLDKSVIGNKRLFGRYHATLSVTYGAQKKVLTDTLTFWVIPFKLIAIIIIVLLALFFGIRYALRRYNRRILEQAQKRGGSGRDHGQHHPRQ